MKDTLSNEEKERLDRESRESNITLHKVEESKKNLAEDRMNDDIGLLHDFCVKGLDIVREI